MLTSERKGEAMTERNGAGDERRGLGAARRAVVVAAGLSAALLTGCERVPSNETGAATTPAGSAAAMPDATAGANDFATGRWRMTTTVRDVQLSADDPVAETIADTMRTQLVGKPQVKEACVTAEQVARGLLELNNSKGDCTTDRNVVADGRIDVALTCRGEDKAVATVRNAGRYDSTAFTSESSVDVVQTGGPGRMTIKAETEGRRLGDCGKG